MVWSYQLRFSNVLCSLVTMSFINRKGEQSRDISRQGLSNSAQEYPVSLVTATPLQSLPYQHQKKAAEVLETLASSNTSPKVGGLLLRDTCVSKDIQISRATTYCDSA